MPELTTGDSLAKNEPITEPKTGLLAPYTGTSIIAQMAQSTKCADDARTAEKKVEDARDQILLLLARKAVLTTSDVFEHSQLRDAIATISEYDVENDAEPKELPGTADVTATGAAAPVHATTTGTVDADPKLDNNKKASGPVSVVVDKPIPFVEAKDLEGKKDEEAK